MKLEVNKVVELLKSKFKFSDPDKVCDTAVGWMRVPHANHVPGLNINCSGNVLHISTAFYIDQLNPLYMTAIQNVVMNELHGVRVFELNQSSSKFINESGVTLNDEDHIICIDMQTLIPNEGEFDLTNMLGFMIESIIRSKDLFDTLMTECVSKLDKPDSNVVQFKPNKFKS